MRKVNVFSYGGIADAKMAGVRYLGRPSALGNPCSRPGVPCPVCGQVHFGEKMVQLTPCRSIDCYRKWLWGKIKSRDKAVLAALAELREGDDLGCWCAPKACHVDVVIAAWKWCKQEGLI